MENSKKTASNGLTRRYILKASGVALGGIVLGGSSAMGAFSATKKQPTNDCNPIGCPTGGLRIPTFLRANAAVHLLQ